MRIDGKVLASTILEDLKKRVLILRNKQIVPRLAIVAVGTDPVSSVYVRQKEAALDKIGARATIVHLPRSTTQSELLKIIQRFSNDNNVHGIIVQRPLPSHLDSDTITETIDLKKDVDGFQPNSSFTMPIAEAIFSILEYIYYSRKNKNTKFVQWLGSKKIVVVGKGETGGGPIRSLFTKMGIGTRGIDSKTLNPNHITRQADIIISAVGKRRIIKSLAIKKGAILISVGLHKENDGKLHGDYEEREIKNIASFYTPSPGGVGPVNVAMLLKNLVTATEQSTH